MSSEIRIRINEKIEGRIPGESARGKIAIVRHFGKFTWPITGREREREREKRKTKNFIIRKGSNSRNDIFNRSFSRGIPRLEPRGEAGVGGVG